MQQEKRGFMLAEMRSSEMCKPIPEGHKPGKFDVLGN
jgi:hypothetical protein